jgi:hypothetical protein
MTGKKAIEGMPSAENDCIKTEGRCEQNTTSIQMTNGHIRNVLLLSLRDGCLKL